MYENKDRERALAPTCETKWRHSHRRVEHLSQIPQLKLKKNSFYSNNYMKAHTAPPKQTAVDTLVTTPTDTGFWAQAKPNIPSSANAKPMNVNKMQKLWQRLSR
jgi:hypothetical protein